MALVVESASNNARKLFAGVDIDAPVSVVWDALTDYDGLGTFIPGMAMMQRHCQMAMCATQPDIAASSPNWKRSPWYDSID